jgi:hypothetical protein
MAMKTNFFGNLFLKLFTLALGLVLLFPCAYRIYTYCAFRYHAVAVNGHVEKSMQGHDIGGRPLVEYKDTQGNVLEVRSKAKTNWFFAPKKGDEIRVLFLKRDPQVAIVDSVFYYILLPLTFCVIGAAALFYTIK